MTVAELPAGRPAPPAGAAVSRGARTDVRLAAVWARVLYAVGALYLFFDRGGAHLRLPGTTAYVGELTLALGLVVVAAGPRWLHQALAGDTLSAVLVCFMAWGALRAVPDLPRYGVVDTVHDSALFYYGLFAVLTLAVAEAVPDLPARLVRGFGTVLPWLSVWLPTTFLLSKFGVRIPPIPFLDNAPLLDHKGGNVAVVAAAGLAYLLLVPDSRFDRRRRWLFGLLDLGTVGLAATQTRGGALAAAVGLALAVWFLPRRRRARVLVAGAVVALAVAVVAAGTGLAVTTDKRTISFDAAVAEVSSVLHPQTSGGGGSGKLLGTEQFRLRLWSTILAKEVDSGRLITGFGFGPNLASLGGVRLSHAADSVDELRSAHNSHVDVLARMGLVGAFLWLVLWAGWLRRMARARRRLRRAGHRADQGVVELLMATVVAVLVNAFFDPTFESAQVAAVAFTAFAVGVVCARRGVLDPAVA